MVFGKHDTSVVWAVVIPEKPAKLAARAKGGGEEIRCVFLRFNPALVAELFPKKTVRGQGSPMLAYEGKRVFAWKINAAWQSGNQPVIPWKQSIVVDVSTDAGRRFFMVDTDKSEVKYEPFFEQKPLPTSRPISKTDALAAFDETWEAFDREYPTFVLKAEVDWSAIRKQWRKSAETAKTSYEAAAAIAGMLQPLGSSEAPDRLPVPRPSGRTLRDSTGTGYAIPGALTGLMGELMTRHFPSRCERPASARVSALPTASGSCRGRRCRRRCRRTNRSWPPA